MQETILVFLVFNNSMITVFLDLKSIIYINYSMNPGMGFHYMAKAIDLMADTLSLSYIYSTYSSSKLDSYLIVAILRVM